MEWLCTICIHVFLYLLVLTSACRKHSHGTLRHTFNRETVQVPDPYGNPQVQSATLGSLLEAFYMCSCMHPYHILFEFICFYIRSIFFLKRGSSCIAWNELEFILQLLGWQVCATMTVIFMWIKDVLRTREMGFVGKGTRHQAWWPGLNPWNSRSGRSETTSTSCPLISIHVLWYVYMYPITHIYIYIHTKEIDK